MRLQYKGFDTRVLVLYPWLLRQARGAKSRGPRPGCTVGAAMLVSRPQYHGLGTTILVVGPCCSIKATVLRLWYQGRNSSGPRPWCQGHGDGSAVLGPWWWYQGLNTRILVLRPWLWRLIAVTRLQCRDRGIRATVSRLWYQGRSTEAMGPRPWGHGAKAMALRPQY